MLQTQKLLTFFLHPFSRDYFFFSDVVNLRLKSKFPLSFLSLGILQTFTFTKKKRKKKEQKVENADPLLGRATSEPRPHLSDHLSECTDYLSYHLINTLYHYAKLQLPLQRNRDHVGNSILVRKDLSTDGRQPFKFRIYHK